MRKEARTIQVVIINVTTDITAVGNYTNLVVLVQIAQNYAQWHNLQYAQHVAHQVTQYCESYAQ